MKMRLGRRRRLPVRVLLVSIALGSLILFELYRWLMPFVARNPLYHEVTIGQPVINAWQYGGEDQEGYLRFFNKSTGQSSVLPPTSKLFGADGKFVVIEDVRPGSLTFAEPIEGAPPIWYALMVGFVGLSLWLMMFRLRVLRKRRMHLRAQTKLQNPFATQPLSKGRRFRASKNQRPRFFR